MKPDLLKSLFKEVNDQGITMIVVTHEHDIAEQSKRIIRLRDGLIERSERVRTEQISNE